MFEQQGKRLSAVIGNTWVVAPLAVLCILLIAVPSVWSSSSKPMELSHAWFQPPHTTDSLIIKWWADEVGKRTKGMVTIKIYWGGTLAGPREIAEAVRMGTADMGCTVWGAYHPQQFSLYLINDWPVPFQKKPLAFWKTTEQLSKEFSEEFDAMLAANNVKRLTYFGIGNTHIISKKPIYSIADFKGLKIRCSGPLHTTLLKAVGAAPINIPVMAAYDALQKGVMDGSVSSIDFMYWFKLYEPCKYFTTVGMGGSPNTGTMINLDVWKKLSPDIQQVLRELREEFPEYAANTQAKDTAAAYKAMEENGVKIIELPAAELEAWKNMPAVKELPQKWMGAVSKWSKLPKTKLTEMLERYKKVYSDYSERFPLEW